MLLDPVRDSLQQRFATSRLGNVHTNWFWKYISKNDIDIDSTALEVLIKISLPTLLISIKRHSDLSDAAIKVGQDLTERFNIELKEDNDKNTKLYSLGLKILEAYCNVDKPEYNFSLFTIIDTNLDIITNTFYKIKKFHGMRLLDHDLYDKLWNHLDIGDEVGLPLKIQPHPWYDSVNNDGTRIINRYNNKFLNILDKTTNKSVMNFLNRLQSIRYCINKEVLDVYSEIFNQHTIKDVQEYDFKLNLDSPFEHLKEPMQLQRSSKYYEADCVHRLAKSYINIPFYHKYQLSSRGLAHPLSAFLHEQGTDNAKGLLLYKDAKPLGDNGHFWLLVYTATCFGRDSSTLEDKVDWVKKNFKTFESYVDNPTKNTDWCKAQQPWVFLACCYQLKHLSDWTQSGNKIEDYICPLPIYLSSNCSPLQHIAAITKDEMLSNQTNLTKNVHPYDIHATISHRVWDCLAISWRLYKSELRNVSRDVVEEIIDLRRSLEKAPMLKKGEHLFKLANLSGKYKDRIKVKYLGIYFWLLLQKYPSLQKKLINKALDLIGIGTHRLNVLRKLKEDRRSLGELFSFTEPLWVNSLLLFINTTISARYKAISKVNEVNTTIVKRYIKLKRDLLFLTPLVDFPILLNNHRFKGKDRVGFQRQFAFCGLGISSNEKRFRGGQEFIYRRSPGIWITCVPFTESNLIGIRNKFANVSIVTSFMSAHITLVVNASSFDVTVSNNNFACNASDASELFHIIREQFVNFYNTNPMDNILEQLGHEDLKIQQGSFDLEDVLESDFFYC